MISNGYLPNSDSSTLRTANLFNPVHFTKMYNTYSNRYVKTGYYRLNDKGSLIRLRFTLQSKKTPASGTSLYKLENTNVENLTTGNTQNLGNSSNSHGFSTGSISYHVWSVSRY